MNERDGMDKNTGKFDSSVSTSNNVITRSVTCFTCGEEGHIKPNCPSKLKNKRVQNNSRPQEDSGTLNSEKVSEQVRDESLPNVARVGKSYFVRVLFNGRAHRGLVNTGAERSMVPARFSVGIDINVWDQEYLSAVNNTGVEVLGEILTNLMIGDLCLPSKFLVSGQVDEIILGNDWLINNAVNR